MMYAVAIAIQFLLCTCQGQPGELTIDPAAQQNLATLLLALGPSNGPRTISASAHRRPRSQIAMSDSRKGLGSATKLESSSRSAQVVQQLAAQLDDDQPPEIVQQLGELLITAMRLGTCALMVHHGLDKIQNVDGFSANVVAKFFGFLPGPPQFWTYSAAATQVVGAGLLGLGLFSRPTAAAMSTTMVVAVIFHLLNTGPEAFPLGVPKAHSYNYELAVMYVLVLSYFAAAGAGKFSLDEQVLGGELKFYQQLLSNFNGDKQDSK